MRCACWKGGRWRTSPSPVAAGKDWYIGSLTNWDERSVRVPLNFLGEGKYTAEIYADAPEAGINATQTAFSKQAVDHNTALKIRMVSGGGNAIWIHPDVPTQ